MATKDVKRTMITALPGVLVIALAAGALTYGAKVTVAEATKPKAAEVKTVTVAETSGEATTDGATAEGGANSSTSVSAGKSSASVSTKTNASAQSSTPTAEPATKTAKTNSFVYLRPSASTSGTALAGLEVGTEVQYESESTTLWQKVTVNGKTGYVYKKWLTF